MFLPGRNADEEKQQKQIFFKKIEGWSEGLLPEEVKGECTVSVQEIQCGDPNCAPIDTAISLIFQSGGQGLFGLPMEAQEVTLEEIKSNFPTDDVLGKWHKGEEAEWPPHEPIDLRFKIGQQVFCRVGPTDWSEGEVLELWYREPNWPTGSFAPYKIRLADGRQIYAPADMDQVIRINPDKQA
mmetsp:Transcript_272/g.370  ORF Transcript_272/g.370 Transcript_272/m.370 type:complete len:183 (+) Transcript_272:224-772(+)|eukprot:CAMPEP_0198141544 /NCGR_PEP_ID=MMETSP1443-20131203/4532_1 /TAXON_ID=186043 /ORGANISM="Entomoneis sp., Strain CCMP2396" /LENGTH=182 /DNA_ID=CAMNT_0043804327 /DNA_START=203 /DNA_END=751 /DNA_ORIENTATION=+